ncbi:MAG TPA: APC family permease [Terriglobia bacterium]|nr:APC family permease [Terriglobia bacterium]
MPEAENRPPRVLGFRDLVLFYLVTGVSLRWIATAAAAGPSSLVVWILAWATFFVPLALCVLELSSRHPDEGGLYAWSKRAFGDFSGFMAAWTYWTSNLPYFPAVLYFAASNALFIGGDRWQRLADNRLYFILFALAGLALPTVLNVIGLNLGKWLNNAGAVGMWLPVLMVIVIGVVAWAHFGSATRFTASSLVPSFRLKDVIFWSTIWYAFGGCEAASFMGEEIHDARRTIPRALIVGGICITLVYMLGTFFVLLAVPSRQVNDLQGLIQAIGASAQRLGLLPLVPIAAFLITLSNVGASGAFLAATARLPFVAGIDRYLPPAFARLHPKWRTPYVAIWAQSLCGMIFVFLGQAGSSVREAYDVLVSMGVIAYFIPYLFVFASMIKLQREPAGPGVIRVPGGKPAAVTLACVGFATTSGAILLACVPGPDATHRTLAVVKVLSLTAALLGAGVLVYVRNSRRSKVTSTS